MNIAVLGAENSWYFRDLHRAAAGAHRLTSVAFERLAALVTAEGGQVVSGGDDLAAYDAVLVRTMPPGSLEQVVLRMDLLGQLERSGTLVVNPPRAIEVAVDKYLATAKLQQAGLTVPRTAVCQTVDDALDRFRAFGGDVVVKPLFGAEGRGIARIGDEALMLRAAKLLTDLGAVVYLQEFVDHKGQDYRLLVVGERVFGMRRINRDDWRTNVSRGATTAALPVDDNLAEIARRAARATGTRLAGVDLLPAKDGTLYVIEVNAVPGWRALQRTLNIDIAAIVLQDLEGALSAAIGERSG
jgi:RimK family alpha-L-glutamate ligase